LLNDAEKQSIVDMLKVFIEGRNKEFSQITVEQYTNELDEADNEIEEGEFVNHDEVKKLFMK
jgi:predicted transcriptional regulator